MSGPSRNRGLATDVLILSVTWGCAVALAHPAGNFPLNDDWSYALAVRRLLEQGTFQPTGWTSMPLLSHVLWGALFCLPFGFSFNALRASTLSASLAGVLGVYLTAKALRQPRWVALVAAFTLGFNPIYFALSHTFMTDVPFTALTVLAVLCAVKSTEFGSGRSWWRGAALASLATLSRHVGVLLTPAFVVAAPAERPSNARWAHRAAIILAPGLGALLAYAAVFGSSLDPRAWYLPVRVHLGQLARNPLAPMWNAVVLTLYLGLFTSPVSLARREAGLEPRPAALLKGRGRPFRIALWSGAVATIALLATGRLIPVAQNGNVLVAQGIGPLTLRDMHILGLPHVTPLPTLLWAVVTALAAFFGLVMLQRVVCAARGTTQSDSALAPGGLQRKTKAALVAAAAALGVPFLLLGGFDRYLLPLVPLAMLLMLGEPEEQWNELEKRRPSLGSILAVGLLAVFSVASTHDYLSWNRARWQALSELTSARSVSARQIDGGFEFNGLSLYSQDYVREESKSWWWVEDDSYVVAFGTIPGYEEAGRYCYSKWLPPRSGEIVILRRLPRH